MKNLFYILLLATVGQCKSKQDNSFKQFAGEPAVPSSIMKTHGHLLEQLKNITLYNDSSIQVALKIEELMQHHFKEEENLILPLLGLLPSIAKGQRPENSEDIIFLSGNVRSQMDHMSAEHQLINAFIEELKQTSDIQSMAEINIFQSEVIQHAKSEEEIFFPASILIGEYLKSRSGIKP